MKGSLDLTIEQIVMCDAASDGKGLGQPEALEAMAEVESRFGYPAAHVRKFLESMNDSVGVPADKYKAIRMEFFGADGEDVEKCLADTGLVRWLMYLKLGDGYISPDGLFNAGVELLVRQRYADAKQCADMLVYIDPKDNRYIMLQSESSEKLKDEMVNGAEIILVGCDGTSDRARHEQAIELYMEAVELDQKNASLYHRLSMLYTHLHDMSCDFKLIENAAVFAGHALSLEPKNLEYRMNFDWVRVKLLADVKDPSPQVRKLLAM